MPQSELDPDVDSIPQLLESLLSCPEARFDNWIQKNRPSLSLAFLQHLKDMCISSRHILENPEQTNLITRYALVIAAHSCFDEPLALALAQWMRGLWAMHNDVANAIVWFRSALPAYEHEDDKLSVARLLSNLVGVLAETGEASKAEGCYHQARLLLEELVEQEPVYLVNLQQNFGWLLHTWGRYDEALLVHDRALALAIQHNLPLNPIHIRINRSLTLGRLGRFGEVEEGLLQERRIALEQGQLVTVARIDMDLGELYTILGRPVEALKQFQLAASGLVPMEQGLVCAMRATLFRQLGALRAALSEYEHALPMITEYELKTLLGETLVNQAICLRMLGERKTLSRANKILIEAHTLWQQLGNTDWLTQVSFEQILLALAQENSDLALDRLSKIPKLITTPRLQAEFQLLRAETHRITDRSKDAGRAITTDYENVLTYATEHHLHWLRRSALSGLGKIKLKYDWHKARGLLEEAAAIDDHMRQTLTLQELKASFHEQANDLYDDLIHHAYLHQEYDEMLIYAWRSKASAFLDIASSLNSESEYTIEQRREIDFLRQRIASVRWSLAKEEENRALGNNYEESDPELARLTEQLIEVRRQARQQQGQISSIAIEQLQNTLLAMDAEILIEYVRCGHELYAIYATKQGIRGAVRLVDEPTIAELAGTFARDFRGFHKLSADERASVVDIRIAECKPFLNACYQHLIAPFAEVLQTIPQGCKILIAPCDTLAMLPFAAFWDEDYWVVKYEIELIQSGALLQLDLPTTSNYSPSIVVAASTGTAIAVRQEAKAVAQILNSSISSIDTPILNYLDALQDPPRILHIAAHTIKREKAPLFSGIQLHGEVLSVEHCFDLPLWGSELVTLSGCATASGMNSDASLFAFQSALLIAGARRVLCTLWEVADGAPCPLMVDFYQHLDKGLAIPTALRKTQLHFLTDPVYRHPALWAAFTCIRR